MVVRRFVLVPLIGYVSSIVRSLWSCLVGDVGAERKSLAEEMSALSEGLVCGGGKSEMAAGSKGSGHGGKSNMHVI